MKAKAERTFCGLVSGNIYDVVEVNGSNIIINLDGVNIGFTHSYLKLVKDEEKLKELKDELSSVISSINKFKDRKSELELRIREIEEGLVNQIELKL